MATIKLKIIVDELTNVMSQFNQIKVYRCATRDGTYVEITGPGTRVNLVVAQTLYEYIDTTAPNSTYWYKTSYYHSSTSLESSLSAARQGSDAGLYVTLQDLRDEGFDVSDITDERALFLLRGWQDWFEYRTKMWFLPKYLDFYVDGNGSNVLWLPIPIISIEALYVNEETVATDPTYYTVYNSRSLINDDRKNPRIKLKRTTNSIFSSVRGNASFVVGDRNQRLVGYFGYVESDDTVPFLVRRAIMTMVVATIANMSDGDIDAMRAGRAVEEVTDRHRIKFANLWDEIGAWKVTGLFEVDEALALYRRPAYIGMARSFIV
jgi:hypothetical protein